MRLDIRVHPRAAHQRVDWDGALAQVFVTTPAADGLANRAVLGALAAWSAVPTRRIRIVAGARSRSKVVEIDGLGELPGRR